DHLLPGPSPRAAAGEAVIDWSLPFFALGFAIGFGATRFVLWRLRQPGLFTLWRRGRSGLLGGR
ncbi:MAG: hypothetical protein ACREEC_02005, partial [Thermoplasmata archaeon]